VDGRVKPVKPGHDERYRFDFFAFFAFLDFFAVFFEAAARFVEAFFGTFLPLALASDRPIAIACLRLLTVRPERPLFKVPVLRFFIARLTSADAFFEYLRAMTFLRWRENNSLRQARFRIQPRFDLH